MKLKILVILSVLAAVISCTMPSTGRGKLTGVVTQSSTGEPVENVQVKYSNIVVLTDAAGNYSFDDMPEGLQGITFSKAGFSTLVSMVDIPRDEVAVNDVTIDVMAAGWAVGNVETEYGTVFYTEDGGITWVRQGSYSVIPPNDLYSVCAVNTKTCWIAGDTTFNVLRNRMEFSILKTSDAGENWRRQGQTIGTLTACPIVGITAVDTSTVWAVTDTNVIVKGTQGGSSWSLCYTSQYSDRYQAVSTCDGIHIWAGGTVIEGGSSGLDYSPNGGSSWTFVPIPVSGDGGVITSISAVDTNMVYISGNFGVLRTIDGGSSWETVMSDGPYTAFSSLGSFCCWTADADGGLRYSFDAFVHSDAAALQAPVADISITSISVLGDAAQGALTYFTNDRTSPGGILNTIDGGQTWNETVTPYKVVLHDISFAGTKH